MVQDLPSYILWQNVRTQTKWQMTRVSALCAHSIGIGHFNPHSTSNVTYLGRLRLASNLQKKIELQHPGIGVSFLVFNWYKILCAVRILSSSSLQTCENMFYVSVEQESSRKLGKIVPWSSRWLEAFWLLCVSVAMASCDIFRLYVGLVPADIQS